MANIRTYEITFAHLSEYSSPISVYSGSLLQPLSITVGNWFATGSGTVSLLASYDNQIYNVVYSTTASNNSVIYLSVPSFVGSFIKIQRELTTLTLSGSLVNNSTVESNVENNTVVFSSPQSIQINDEVFALETLYFPGGGSVTIPLLLGTSQQSTIESIYCTFTSPPLYTRYALPLSIVRKSPRATGVLTCTFMESSVVSISIDY